MEKYVTYFIIGITVFTSWQAWERPELFNRLKFQMSAILDQKQYDRIFTSGLIHADGMHLLFNMFALYVFMPVVLYVFSVKVTILIYVLSIISGSLFTIAAHHKDRWYSAVGASGGVSGIVFAAIILFPQMPLQIVFFPFFSFPAWLFGVIYLGYSIFGMKRNIGNLGHAAHIGGSLVGIVISLYLKF
ncbi:rhomboid family intramembrane serine protease [Ornithobacterium rhinotracheale]|uniref:rhomboid family intramembrane serine protease n=1 Tax=Ornithobacterium rhinotracheale TaxID=28251 RepID=UPI00129D20F6|nr:rhomboid family intramembrane serine protease [Ornithobacterium rhinotracheale]MRI62430.1 rhomboid family intramembrane serine protease [Ornithobacterium rhinotracheale]MRJ07524.1 rhomboid family intramembrane serine protease [Ornithobacterium rhinotracheale]MRJ10839.1 rhomboid family intramembrane serine protease [Ornithobacterium rhinotracheale]UOH78118.1 rhomboid family intramembrane serine protease [Ornithobacterium rhinotracheale]